MPSLRRFAPGCMGAPNAARFEVAVASAVLCVAVLGFSGCGTPGAPQPPSLHLPGRVEDLAAKRAAGDVSLRWTMPRKTTDHLMIKDLVVVAICRREGTVPETATQKNSPVSAGASGCQQVGKLSLAASEPGTFRDVLPASLQAGAPRLVTYAVELRNAKGRSAGLSNGASILAGSAPGNVDGLTAEPHPDGVALHWSGSETTAVRLHRRLFNPPQKKPQGKGALTRPPELELQDLIVDAPAAGQTPGALDSTAHVGETYEYTAQRVDKVIVGEKILELAGTVSPAVKIKVEDIFPPAVPTGLEAVFAGPDSSGQDTNAQNPGITSSENPGTHGSIDLSWQPNREPDLAGYFVYRTEDGAEWKRVSPAQPLLSPAWRDASVAAGHAYRYAVTAVDQTGHESKRSAEARETTPSS